MEIDAILFQVEKHPGYMICDPKTDNYIHYGITGEQSRRKGLKDGDY